LLNPEVGTRKVKKGIEHSRVGGRLKEEIKKAPKGGKDSKQGSPGQNSAKKKRESGLVKRGEWKFLK